jgi:radical SAM protein with 4Fe4S-binding SPASM domain
MAPLNTDRVQPDVPTPDDTTQLRTSNFSHVNADRVYSDLTGRSKRLTLQERAVIRRGIQGPFTAAEISSSWEWSPASAEEVVHRLLTEGWLVPNEVDEASLFRIDWADIETTRQCNARCGFCPQSSKPKSPATMDLKLFRHIVTALTPYRPKSISLNHYGEPLLDPHFKDRCEILKHHALPLLLFTNGTLLSEPLIEYILNNSLLRAVVFNYPSAHPREWAHFMRLPERFHSTVTAAIRRLAQDDKNTVEIFVNGVTDCQSRRATDVENLFSNFPNVRVLCFPSDDRAGAQQSLVSVTDKTHTPRLSGCDRILRYMHFRYDGEVYLCCQDYDQRVVVGNIRLQSPAEIMSSERARQLRRQIYGMEEAPFDFICRSCSRIRKSRIV